ncbi:MAG: hypothetical protein JJW00_00240 [Sulfurimonas sp.]|nr:hypothetical protein [Sulfurimonas sp.]
MQKIKVELKCNFGLSVAGDIVEINSTIATAMIARGDARDGRNKNLPSEDKIKPLNLEISKLKALNKKLETKIRALTKQTTAIKK